MRKSVEKRLQALEEAITKDSLTLTDSEDENSKIILKFENGELKTYKVTTTVTLQELTTIETN